MISDFLVTVSTTYEKPCITFLSFLTEQIIFNRHMSKQN